MNLVSLTLMYLSNPLDLESLVRFLTVRIITPIDISKNDMRDLDKNAEIPPTIR